MKEFANNETWIVALRKGATAAIEQLYRTSYTPVENLVRFNNGTREDAKDLFQECMIILIQKLRAPDFSIAVKPSTFLYGIAKNQWRNRLRKNARNPIDLVLDEPESRIQSTEQDDTLLNYELEDVKEQQGFFAIVKRKFEQLGEDCQNIIKMKHIHRCSHKEIMEEMDLTANYARVKLHNCMETLRKLAKGGA